MPTECSGDLLGFAPVEGREVVAAFDGGPITSDAGALLLGATDRAIGMMERFAACFHDERRQELIEHEVVTLLGQRVFGIALGYEDLNDHDKLRHDPMMAVLAGKLEARREDCAPVAGKSTLNRLELSRLEATRYHKISHNPIAIKRLMVDLFLEAHQRAPSEIILDLDATDDPVHGEQEGRFFHGYYDCYCYLPLYVFCGRHLLDAKLRRASVDAADGAVEAVARIVAQIRRRWPKVRILVRADSGFAREELMAWCEANGVHFLFGLAQNERLVAMIAGELAQAETKSRRTGKPARYFKEFRWQTRRSWSRERRVIAKAEFTGDGPIRALSLPRSRGANASPNISTKSSTAPTATWRNASRSASSISMPTAPRPPRCGPTSCACGSPRWPMCCSAPCGGSACTTPASTTPAAVPFASRCSRSAPWCASACAASKLQWHRAAPQRRSGAPPPFVSKPRQARAARRPDTRRRGAHKRHHLQAHRDPFFATPRSPEKFQLPRASPDATQWRASPIKTKPSRDIGCMREENPCQPGAVHTWPDSEQAVLRRWVWSLG
jgi:hypothetical protein